VGVTAEAPKGAEADKTTSRFIAIGEMANMKII